MWREARDYLVLIAIVTALAIVAAMIANRVAPSSDERNPHSARMAAFMQLALDRREAVGL